MYSLLRKNLSLELALAALLLLPATNAAGAPGDILFSDDFERGALAPWTTSNAGRSGIATGGPQSNSPNRGAFTRNNVVTLTSPTFSTSVPAATLSIWVRRGSDAFSELPDGGENLVLEYRRSNNTWGSLATFTGGGTPGQVFQNTIGLPPDGLHGNFAIRVRQTGGSGFDFDYWHIDDTVVTERAPFVALGVGSCEDFESGLAGNWTVNATGGFAGTSAATSQSPISAMFTNGGIVQVVSNVIDTSDPAFGNLTMWIRRGSDTFSEDPDGGENLLVEYLNAVGTWIALETFNGAGGAGQTFPRSYLLPAGGRHAGFRLRFRQTGGDGAAWDFWHVDDVCFDTKLLPDLQVTKAVQTISDPVNGVSNPFSIPGAIKQYTITVTNTGPGAIDSGTLVVTDTIQTDTALFVDTSGGDPIVFIDGTDASGLAYSYSTDVTFSNQPGGAAPYTYTPVPDGSGYDPAVTAIRVQPAGVMNAAGGGTTPSFDLVLQLRVQ